MTLSAATEIAGLLTSFGDNAVLEGVDLRVPAGRRLLLRVTGRHRVLVGHGWRQIRLAAVVASAMTRSLGDPVDARVSIVMETQTSPLRK